MAVDSVVKFLGSVVVALRWSLILLSPFMLLNYAIKGNLGFWLWVFILGGNLFNHWRDNREPRRA